MVAEEGKDVGQSLGLLEGERQRVRGELFKS